MTTKLTVPKARYQESFNTRNQGHHFTTRRRPPGPPQLLPSHRRPDYSKAKHPDIFSRGWGRVPSLLTWDCRLNLEQHAILDYLIVNAHSVSKPPEEPKPPVVYSSLRTIAGDLRCSQKRVVRILRELEALGYISRGKRVTDRSIANQYAMECLTINWWLANKEWFQPAPLARSAAERSRLVEPLRD